MWFAGLSCARRCPRGQPADYKAHKTLCPHGGERRFVARTTVAGPTKAAHRRPFPFRRAVQSEVPTRTVLRIDPNHDRLPIGEGSVLDRNAAMAAIPAVMRPRQCVARSPK